MEAVSKKLMELNPGFDGKLTDGEGKPPFIENGVVKRLGFATDNVTDISPVRALTGLSCLNCSGSGPEKGRLSDLSPLKGMPLANLRFREHKSLRPVPATRYADLVTRVRRNASHRSFATSRDALDQPRYHTNKDL